MHRLSTRRWRGWSAPSPSPSVLGALLRSYSHSHAAATAANPSAATTNPSSTTTSTSNPIHDQSSPLPVPQLRPSLDALLAAVRPLVPADSPGFEQLQRHVRDFLAGPGPRLQSDLELVAAVTPTNWTHLCWDDGVLASRPTPAIHRNPFMLLANPTGTADVVQRSAQLLVSMRQFVRRFQKNQLTMEFEGNAPLCMRQYSLLFGSARIPELDRDRLSAAPSISRHVMVLHRGHMYKLNLFGDNIDDQIPYEIIKASLNAIIAKSPQVHEQYRLPALTCAPRPVWSLCRSVLEKSSAQNRKQLAEVDQALFILCLDDNVIPNSLSETCSVMLHNRGYNRWFDKLQLIVCGDGQAGVNIEQSFVDPHTVMRCVSEMVQFEGLQFSQSSSTSASQSSSSNKENSELFSAAVRAAASPSSSSSSSLSNSNSTSPSASDDCLPPTPTKDAFVADNPAPAGVSMGRRSWESLLRSVFAPQRFAWDMNDAVRERLADSHYHFRSFADRIVSRAAVIDSVGAAGLRALQLTPDSFVQAAIQLATHRVFAPDGVAKRTLATGDSVVDGQSAPTTSTTSTNSVVVDLFPRARSWPIHTIETLLMKRFRWGRTDVLHSVTPEMETMCTMVDDPDLTIDKKVAALRRAMTTHNDAARRLKSGSGFDRHLFALERLATYHALDCPLFTDPLYTSVFRPPTISTSNCSSEHIQMFGFGPATGDGWAVGYVVRKNDIRIHTSGSNDLVVPFAAAITDAVVDLYRLAGSK